jgi:hypothetical protein
MPSSHRGSALTSSTTGLRSHPARAPALLTKLSIPQWFQPLLNQRLHLPGIGDIGHARRPSASLARAQSANPAQAAESSCFATTSLRTTWAPACASRSAMVRPSPCCPLHLSPAQPCRQADPCRASPQHQLRWSLRACHRQPGRNFPFRANISNGQRVRAECRSPKQLAEVCFAFDQYR